MAQILIRNLKPEVVRRLKDRAASKGRSLQSEAQGILEREAAIPALDPESARKLAERIAKLVGRPRPESTKVIRAARDRRGRS